MKYHFIHERGDYPLLAVEEIARVWSSDIKKVVGQAESPMFFIYENGWVRIYSYQSRYKKIVDYIFKKINKNKDYVKKIKSIFIKKANVFLKFEKQLSKTDFKKLNNRQLVNLKEKYVKFYHQNAPYGEPLPYFLKEKLQQIIDDYLINKLKIPAEDYRVLITPIYQSFFGKEKGDLFKIKQETDKNKIKKAIENHAKKYKWILFDYASLMVDEEYFREREIKRKSEID
jgi:hypothetical protein